MQDVAGRTPMTISAVSTMLGIPVPTIRSWERRYGFPTPDRTGGRHRRYSPQDVELLRLLRDEITRGNRARDAVELIRRAPPDRIPRAGFVEDFLSAAMRLDPTGLRSALDGAGQGLGVEDAVRDVVLAAMREIGDRWRTGACDVANEHLATEAVRSWLARMIAMSPPPFRPGAVVLACGPKELHTIGLEAFTLLLRRRGWSCRLLGALTPSRSVVAAVQATGAVAGVIASQRSVTRRAAVETVAAVDAIPGTTAFYAGNAFSAPSARARVPGVYLGPHVVEATSILERSITSPRRRRP